VRSEAREPPPELEPFVGVPARSGEDRFDGGRGSLRGHVESSSEEPFPRAWRLVIGPSSTLPGRERAVRRTIAFEDGRQDFAVHDLPLGGYDLLAEAEGYQGMVLPVLLERGNEDPFVNLRILPAGYLTGRVLQHGGLPAERLPVTLLGLPEDAARRVHTDAGGVFRFEALPDGAYELLIGDLAAPVLPERRPLRFSAPSMTLPDLELPVLGRIELRVLDSLDRPVEGVRVRGSGTNGGTIEETSDYDGRIRARHLPAGHYRIRLEHPELGERRIAIELGAGEVVEQGVRLGP
jgi:hypothetical protein